MNRALPSDLELDAIMRRYFPRTQITSAYRAIMRDAIIADRAAQHHASTGNTLTFEEWYMQQTGKLPTLAGARYYALTKEASIAKAAWTAALALKASTQP